MSNKTLSKAGLKLIMQFEGCRLTAYQCAAGVWTIGYGHTAGVKKGMNITQAQAEEYLRQDCDKFVKYVNNRSYVPIADSLNQNQFDALVSFTYNCGAGNLKKLCASRTAEQIADALPLYNKAAGKTLTGLIRRRAVEVKLFNTPVTGNAEKAESKAEQQEDYDMKTIKRGAKGNAVKVWQIIVGTNPDGIFGSGTENATRTWQESKGLSVDGIVGKNSWKAGLESL